MFDKAVVVKDVLPRPNYIDRHGARQGVAELYVPAAARSSTWWISPEKKSIESAWRMSIRSTSLSLAVPLSGLFAHLRVERFVLVKPA